MGLSSIDASTVVASSSSPSTLDPNGISAAALKRTNKTHVPSACVNCKRAHLACDVSRPCKRCVALGKVDTCIDIKHKKRGRPKLKDKKTYPYSTYATADAKTHLPLNLLYNRHNL
ncbi:9027_t:CDS:2 [Ambispora gerdemannii]|uniref:9027_t:CDS:1 n=1 Tax=Ambispora gerdemannii TaxID=144530 RepID=A0A9N8W7L5_9GLOM|nr:9027_t:CDS:2 [Ambispora gerdemannii]